MTTTALLLWVVVMLVGFAGSALYSGLETGAYSLNRVRLEIYYHQQYHSARILRWLLHHPTVLLTTLLIGNNITNYMGTAALAVILEAQRFTDWQVVVLNTAIVTPVLFVFGETLPKDLFAAYADRLMYRLTAVLEWSRRLFTWTGLVPAIGVVTRGVMAALGAEGEMRPFHPRRQVEALVKEGVGYGLLSDDQSAMVARVLKLANLKVGDEMTPWRQVLTVNVDEPPRKFWELADRTSRTRFPVLEGERVVGVVHVLDALRHGRAACPPIRELMQPPVLLPATLPLRQGLSELQQRHAALAIITDQTGQPIGIATVKDLVEPITGELTSW